MNIKVIRIYAKKYPLGLIWQGERKAAQCVYSKQMEKPGKTNVRHVTGIEECFDWGIIASAEHINEPRKTAMRLNNEHSMNTDF